MAGQAITRWIRVEPGEVRPTLLAAAAQFCVLASFTVLRPVREEMGIQGGTDKLPWVFTATFLGIVAAQLLFGAVAPRIPRRALAPAVHGFFLTNLLAFLVLFASGAGREWVARAFFVWVSVFNLVAVSVLWALMADLFRDRQARRLFPVIAAGASAGALAGPAVATALARSGGPVVLVAVATALLTAGIACSALLPRVVGYQPSGGGEGEGPGPPVPSKLSGHVLTGLFRVARSPYLLGVSGYMVLYTTLSTFLYLSQAQLVRDALPDPGDRTALFARMDLFVNLLTLPAQVLGTSRLVGRFGLGAALAAIPLATGAGFAWLAATPVLGVLVVFQVLRRAGEYAVTRPAREMLFPVLPREDRYLSKGVIDTVVYRGGDAVSAWAFAALSAVGMALGGIALVAVPLAGAWAALGLGLGRAQARRARVQSEQGG